MAILEAEKVSYTYRSKYQSVEAVKEVSCSFEAGKIYAIVGESGSGKSTLLSLLAGLDVPTAGRILLEGRDLAKTSRDDYRKYTASVVYQSFWLFPLLTAQENVMFPMELRGMKTRKAAERARELLVQVGLPDTIRRKLPKMMSGGEQQRVAIARALAAEGRILLCDEPTGNLDSENERHVVELLGHLARQQDYAVILITHNLWVASQTDVVYRMKDGRMMADKEAGREAFL